jgi:hypothetical protein
MSGEDLDMSGPAHDPAVPEGPEIAGWLSESITQSSAEVGKSRVTARSEEGRTSIRWRKFARWLFTMHELHKSTGTAQSLHR